MRRAESLILHSFIEKSNTCIKEFFMTDIIDVFAREVLEVTPL